MCNALNAVLLEQLQMLYIHKRLVLLLFCM